MRKQNIHGDVSVGYAHIISIFPSYHFQFPLPQHPVLQLQIQMLKKTLKKLRYT